MFWFFCMVWYDLDLWPRNFKVTAHPLTRGTLKFETLEPIGLIFLINCKVVIIFCVITQFYLDAGKTELWEYRNFRTIKHAKPFKYLVSNLMKIWFYDPINNKITENLCSANQ